MSNQPAIEVRDLCKRYGAIKAVDGISFTIPSGQIFSLLGPNGAGKTTTIRMLAGIIAPTSGTATVAGCRIPQEIERLHEHIGLLTESPGFYDRLSARRNMEFFAGFYSSVNVTASIEKYLKVMGLWDRRENRVGTFSKGMKHRLALARALLPEPEVLFLDEPTAGLDPEAAAEVRELIRKMSSEGRTIFLSTHNLAEAEQLCRRIAVIRTRLLVVDSPQNLRNRFFRREIIVRLQAMSEAIASAVRRLPFVQDMSVSEGHLNVHLNDPEQNRPELVKAVVDAGGRIMEVVETRQPLEEVYLKLIHEEEAREP